jgi:hypothetical protein
METTTVFDYIKTQQNLWKTERIPLTRSKSWNMSEHIERCTNVSNGWFHEGTNDGMRPYDDLVTPIIDVAFRSEGFDVKDIVPFADEINQSYKSFLVKKFHPDWAKQHELDTFIDEVVETSIIYDLVLVKDVQSERPEVVDLKTLAFCDQTDIMAGPICIRHQMTIADLLEYKGKWDDDAIDMAIVMAQYEKINNTSGEQTAKTPSKYIDVYELVGKLPEYWIKEDGEQYKYTPQRHYVCFYNTPENEGVGLTLFKGKDKPMNETFFALKIDGVRSKGRACGRSIVERLFEPQVWNNYSAIKIKKILDSAFNLIITDSEELGNQKLTELKSNTILKQAKGDNTQKLTSDINQIPTFQNYQNDQRNSARLLGSASEGALGVNPSSGTPFALQELIVNEGEGIHTYRQGKIATFFADILYPKLILKYLVKEMSNEKTFSEKLSLDEVAYIAEEVAKSEAEKQVEEMIFSNGVVPTREDRQTIMQVIKDNIIQGKTSIYKGGRVFMKTLKDDLKDIPLKVNINIAGKQKYLARNADKLSKLISMVISNPQAFATMPGLAQSFNQLIESSGMNPIDFSYVVENTQQAPDIKTKQISSPVEKEEIKEEKISS